MFFIRVKKEIQSLLTKQGVVERLSEATSTNTKNSEAFVGEVNDSGFKIFKKPKEYVRNAFMPILVGKIEENSEGSTINVTARLSVFCALFWLIWSLGAVILPLIIGIAEPVFLLFALIMASFLALLTIFAFYKPAKKSISILERLISK